MSMSSKLKAVIGQIENCLQAITFEPLKMGGLCIKTVVIRKPVMRAGLRACA